MVHEIGGLTDITFCHSGPFFALFYPYGPRKSKFFKKWKKHLKILSFYKHKWQSYEVWFLRYGVQWTKFFVISDHFLPFYPPNKPKNQNFEKMKKLPRDIIILHRCNINDNHMMYGSWDTEANRQIFLSFWTIFCPFTSLTNKKIKIWKNEKTPRDIIILHMCTINDNHMMYGSWDMKHVTDRIFCHFGLFFALLPC